MRCWSVPFSAPADAASVMRSRICSSARSYSDRNAPSVARSAGILYSVNQRPFTWPNRSSCGRARSSTWLRSMPERVASTVTPPGCQIPRIRRDWSRSARLRTPKSRLGTLTAMPDDERADDKRTPDLEDDGPLFSGFGIASAALGLLCVAAIVLGVMIWSGHRADADERRYQTDVLKAAADWTTVLINMNKDDVDASLQKLHDGTVGELNNEFESAVEPYKK